LEKNRILIIDDSYENINLLKNSLSELYDIHYSISVEEAIEILKRIDFDLILLDIVMKGIDGFRFCKILKSNRESKDIPVIFLTAKFDSQSIVKAFEVGGVDYITKPFNVSELLARIKTHIKLRLLSKSLEILVENRTKELQEKSKKLKDRLLVDPLTSLSNRVKLLKVLENSKEKTLIYLNIDNFTQVNTTYGYQIGNTALIEVGKFLHSNKRESEVFRFASDEFVFLFDDLSLDDAEEFATSLNKKIFKENIIVEDIIKIHVSFTITVVRGECIDILKKAQLAMQDARSHGKNRVLIFSENLEIVKKQQDNIYWMNKVKTSLEDDIVVPFFQGIRDNKLGKITKFEVLARIVDRDKIISPYFFIEPARLVGLITDITKKISQKAFETFENTDYEFSINITSEDLEENYLVSFLDSLCKKHNIAPARVTLEVLEDISVYGSEISIKQLENLKKLGFLIALDDFGSEHASFSRIMDLQIDIIKLDGRFIKNIDRDEKSQLIVEAVIYLAKKLGCKTVAEFVHSKSVQDKVEELGIDCSQGFYFDEPTQDIF